MPELTPEQRARKQIDAQLIACSWVVHDYKQFSPAVGHGIALREAPLKSGTCDYLLLVDRKAVGVIEAKKVGVLRIGVAEQTAHYAVNLPDFIQSIAPGSLPFLYESTGVETDGRTSTSKIAPMLGAHKIAPGKIPSVNTPARADDTI